MILIFVEVEGIHKEAVVMMGKKSKIRHDGIRRGQEEDIGVEVE